MSEASEMHFYISGNAKGRISSRRTELVTSIRNA